MCGGILFALESRRSQLKTKHGFVLLVMGNRESLRALRENGENLRSQPLSSLQLLPGEALHVKHRGCVPVVKLGMQTSRVSAATPGTLTQ